MSDMREHDSEPVPGLPEELPEGETILWQGAPHWPSMARRVFHTHKLVLYFGILTAWRIAASVADGAAISATLIGGAQIVVLGTAAIAILSLLAYLSAKSTIYTITNRRVIMRFGVAVPMTINLPFRTVQAADVKLYGNGTGDIPLFLNTADRLAYLVLWPHARPWHVAKPQPMLRTVPDAQSVAELLSEAWSSRETEQIARARPTQLPSDSDWAAKPLVTATM